MDRARCEGWRSEIDEISLLYYEGDELAEHLAVSGMTAVQVEDAVGNLMPKGYACDNVYAYPWDTVSLTAKGRAALVLS